MLFRKIVERWIFEPYRGAQLRQLQGIDKAFKIFLILARVASVHALIVALFPRGTNNRRKRDFTVDILVLFQLGLVVFLWWFFPGESVSVVIAGYLLFCIYTGILYIFLFSENRAMGDKSTSPSRSLLLLGINAIQIIFSFAIFYERLFALPPKAALFGAFLVTGTIGLPAGADKSYSLVIPLHICLNIVFLGIVLASVASKIRLEFEIQDDDTHPK